MDIKAILKKIANGEALTDEEKDFIAKYDPEGGENRIPKSRLDKEIEKFNAEKARADELDSKLAELREKVETLESSGKSETEKAKAANEKELVKLKQQVVDLTKDRDEARSSLAKSERTAKISALAAKHGFVDPDYLDFLSASKQIDLNDEGAASGFVTELSKSRPELFKSDAKSGGGTKKTDTKDSGAEARLKELMEKPELSSREAGEVIKLQGEINKASGDGEAKKNQGE